MANKILTPVTLWNNFNDGLPIQCKIEDEAEQENILLRRLRFSGREVNGIRVNIYALLAMPKGIGSAPGLLILPDSQRSVDEPLAKRFAKKGYIVLMPDYRGAWEGSEGYTVYPEAIGYANFRDAGRHIDYADESAAETSWYEWVGVARYALRYMQSIAEIAKIGVIGLKTGGDIAWQLAATAEGLACAITVCSGGWRAYRGVYKFGDATELKMNDERYRFLAGVDAQAYAQYVKCPMLMLCSTNDERFDADRAFDTYARINPTMEKTFNFSARYNGHIGNTGLNDLDLFIDKYLKGREVFVPAPVDISIEEDEGELVARIRFDPNGEVKYCEVFMAEDNLDSSLRDWTRCSLKREAGEDEQIFRLNAYRKASRVFAFAKAKYSCGFAVSSKIATKKIDKEYANSTEKSRILYSSVNGTDSFTIDRFDSKVLADCFLDNSVPPVRMIEGPCGIKGLYSAYGLKLFRINDNKYRPEENAILKFDIYASGPCTLQICIATAKAGVSEKYSCSLFLSGSKNWKDHMLSAKDFKNDVSKPLARLSEAQYITFYSDSEFCINNLLWL